jgi:dihydrodipicolinate synthase/N-acetylneuraminate lyase
MFKPAGIYSAMMTPFHADGSLNEEEMHRLVDFLIERVLNGLFPASSVGEALHLTRHQKVRVVEIVVEQTRGRVPITPGVGQPCR